MAALASGIPVVTTRGPLTDQFFIERRVVLLSPNAPESIRSSIESLLADPAAAEALANRARGLYNEAFQPAIITSKLRQATAEIALPVSAERTGPRSRRTRQPLN